MAKEKAIEGFGPDNMIHEVVDNILIIRVDLERVLPNKTSGGNDSIATSHGFARIPGNKAKFSLNVFRKVAKPSVPQGSETYNSGADRG